MTIENQIEIDAPASKVWDVLTNPEKTKIYMFGCETVSDWEVGSELLWRTDYEGKSIVFVKGRIVEIIKPQKLVYTTIDPNGTVADIPENYLNVTYELIENNEKTVLHVTQGDYSKVADGNKRYQESSNNGEGWNPILEHIKKISEL